MRLFHAQLLDHHLEGDGVAATNSDAWTCLLTRAEFLRFTCVVDQVSATPTLSVVMYGGTAVTLAAGFVEGTKVLINTALSAGTNLFSASYTDQDADYPLPREVTVQASISGAAGKAHVQLWVCGRGPQLLETIPAASPSFAAQYAMARMLDDEDRLPQRKRALKQGASLFYPPELFLPSLKWER